MFLIDKEAGLTEQKLAKIIRQFNLGERVKLNKYFNYYNGNQEIMKKVASDVGKPCNRIVTNYCFNIVSTYLGYIAGIPVSYTSDKDFTDIQQILNYNDYHNEDNELLRQALIYGVAYEINYIDEDSRQRFKVLDSRECIPIYDNTLNQELRYIVRYYAADTVNKDLDDYIVEVYDGEVCRRYKSDGAFSSFSLLEEIPHYFHQVPITVFYLNAEKESIFAKIMSLQDAYNNLLSSEVDDFEAFCDAYLLLKGIDAEPEDLRTMKENRVLLMDENSSAEYLTKQVNDAQIQNMLKTVNDTIHKIANAPDFNDEKLLAQSGIAMRYKLVGFENVSASIVSSMKKALQRRLELICAVLQLTDADSIEDWRDVVISFTRNLPTNTLETAQVINQLRGLVSQETLLSLLPFVPDPKAEIERAAAEAAKNINLYSFGDSDEQ